MLLISRLPRAVRQQCRAIRSPAVLCDSLAEVAHLPGFSPLQWQQVQLHRAAAVAQKCEKLSIRRPARGYIMVFSLLCTRQLQRHLGFSRFTPYQPDSAACRVSFGIALMNGEGDERAIG